jgi:NADH pyrophosphatase NudC (nudix superfamily)
MSNDKKIMVTNVYARVTDNNDNCYDYHGEMSVYEIDPVNTFSNDVMKEIIDYYSKENIGIKEISIVTKKQYDNFSNGAIELEGHFETIRYVNYGEYYNTLHECTFCSICGGETDEYTADHTNHCPHCRSSMTGEHLYFRADEKPKNINCEKVQLEDYDDFENWIYGNKNEEQ